MHSGLGNMPHQCTEKPAEESPTCKANPKRSYRNELEFTVENHKHKNKKGLWENVL